MPVSINSGVVVSSFWTDFKSVAITGKSLLVQYDGTDSSVYTIFAVDGSRICYTCTIWTGSIPQTALGAGYTQAQNDSDKSDFETNYKPTANKVLHQLVAGESAAGSTPTVNPVTISGVDGGDLKRILLTDTTGRLNVVGAAADAATAAGNPVMVAGLDQSGNAREPRVDSSFRQLATVTPPWSAVMGTIGSSAIAEMAFGYVATSAKTIVPVRATTYTQISGAPVQVSVKSSSTSDASASTGAKTITITYLTTGAVRKTETITMNGVTAVNSVNTDYAFIEKVVVSTAGSGRTNAGIITVFQGTGGTGTALCSIAASDGRTNLCHHYVTSGKTCYITGLHYASTGGTIGTVTLQITNPAETDVLVPFCSQFRTSGQVTVFDMTFPTPIKVPQSDITNGSFIIAYVTPDATTATTWWVGFSYIEV